ncbi:hypothetical protein KF913_20870 [Candidatus Obscuribacterales bacterium]|nr:hypothetical protein [Candidatus Obscuribacterales bacterium]
MTSWFSTCIIPKMDGIEVCKHYRAQGGQSPILILTGRGTTSIKKLDLTPAR